MASKNGERWGRAWVFVSEARFIRNLRGSSGRVSDIKGPFPDAGRGALRHQTGDMGLQKYRKMMGLWIVHPPPCFFLVFSGGGVWDPRLYQVGLLRSAYCCSGLVRVGQSYSELLRAVYPGHLELLRAA